MTSSPVEFDQVVSLCGERYRRIVLAALANEGRPLTLNDLSKRVYTSTHGTPVSEASESELHEIQVSLYHRHLPKLASTGVVEFDTDEHLVEPTVRLEECQPALSALVDADPELTQPVCT